VSGEIDNAPREFVKPLRAFRLPIVVKPDGAEQTLPPIELVRGRRLPGKVVDENDQPVAGADVQAAWWVVYERWLESAVNGPKWVATMTDAEGVFVLEGIHPIFELPGRVLETEVSLWAAFGDNSTVAPLDVPPLSDAPITLRIVAGQGVALEGRVVDRASRPLSGAIVEIWSEWKSPFGFVVQTPVVFEGAVELVADADGRFRTLSRLVGAGHYRAVARADGFVPNYTAWVRPDATTDERFPDLPLSRLRSVTGRVVDRQARPVARARVFQSGNGVERSETATDELGCFTLAGVPDDAAFIFAEKIGFRFHGQPIPAGANDTETIVDRADEPAEELVSPPTDVLADERIALARRVLAPYVEPAFASTNEDEGYEMLAYLIDVDPAAALERTDAQSLPHVDADTFDFLRGRIAKGLYRENTDEALAVVESIHDPDRRFRAYIDLAGLTEPSQHLRKRELLDQAQLLMVSTNQANLRAIWIYCVADGLLDLGETERAKTLLDEARSIAAALPRAGNGGDARGYVAQALARIDLPSALELVRDLEGDKALDAVHGKIALRIAKAQPAESQRVLDMVRDEFRRGSWAIRVCYRMADADPERARQIAGQIVNPNLRAYALGLMAKAWSSSDKRRALGWFDEAFELLADVVEAGEERIGGPQPAAGVAAALLSVAELIDARLL
ncbi:MAG TPA: carboxypeptidase-like regulatory domain-containing protein, partial [Pirellulales bacterium]|nr:carboxypeptidase-like regulatory domain-containing protein [Pirellulales bacterium]